MDYSTLFSIIKTIRELPKDAAITISDTSRFIYYQPGTKIDIAIKPGEDLREGTVTLKAIKDKKMVSTEVDKEIFGIPYFGTGYPIINNGSIEAVVTAILPSDKGRIRTPIQDKLLIGRKEDMWLPISVDEIIYISSEEGKTFIHTKSGKYQNKFNLTELEHRIPERKFIRCHRSFIVRMDAIEEIHPNFHSTFLLIMKDEKATRVPVSQSYASNFRIWLGF